MDVARLIASTGFSPWHSVDARPVVDEAHRGEVRGVYVIGDVVDAPAIKLALRQGREIGQRIAGELGGPVDDPDVVDVLVIGAGPAGIAAAEAAREAGLRCLVLEQERPFHTLHAFPVGKLIFAEPAELANPTGVPLADAPKEALAARWERWLGGSGIAVHWPERVEGLARDGQQLVVRARVGAAGRSGVHPLSTVPSDGAPGALNTYRARRVVVAVGKRGAIRRLGVPGEDLPHVRHALVDPAAYAGRRALVVGGGDSAVEAAIATAEAGASVALSYRGAELSRPKRGNRERLAALVADGRITFLPNTRPERVTAEAVTLRGPQGPLQVPADDVLVFIGASAPRALLRDLGIRVEGDLRWPRLLWVAAFMALVYAFYVLKRDEGLWPFGSGDPLGALPGLLEVDLGFRVVGAGFWGTVMYSALVVGFGVDALRRYGRDATQRRRYLSLIAFQAVFLFGIPELLIPGLHAAARALGASAGHPVAAFLARGWDFYSLSVPWPLSVWSVVKWPTTPDGLADPTFLWTAVLWSALAAVVSFVVLPLYVWRNNEKFCSYLCGCGGLAETLGDRWRHLAPRGPGSRRLEWAGVVILALAVPVTALLLNDAWGFVSSPFLTDAKVFAQGWYGLMVDFMLASLVGVALYPVLGNRVWCRFFCPLRAYMEVIARRFGRLAIRPDDRCISCGECTRACQMGIEVQRFAELQIPIHNANSACIQCGVCVLVCPMDVLELGPLRDGERALRLKLD
jgi:NosR/NirI family transcriptional regulator, nitrous oxide reductase regulator